jgi:hypothetical protein
VASSRSSSSASKDRSCGSSTFWATASIVDCVLAAPESVVITIESSDEVAQPLEIELPGE